MYIPSKQDKANCRKGINCEYGICDECQMTIHDDQEDEGEEMIKLGIYRHYKGGLYKVIGNAVYTETEEPLVIYHPLGEPSKIWARPESMWNDYIVNADARRFTKVW